MLRPILAVRNTSGEPTRFRGKIPYTTPEGETAFVRLPETRIDADSTKIIRLNRLIENEEVPESVLYAGIELKYDSPAGTIITSVQSVIEDGNQVFEVPMADPGNLPASAGGFPWKADGDYLTIAYLKNETGMSHKYIAHLVHDGGQYSLGIKELKAGETVAIDFHELRDSQTPDAKGNIIPLNMETGQIGWSLRGGVGGGKNKSLTGRSEQISLLDGVASTYACSNCCPNSTQNV